MPRKTATDLTANDVKKAAPKDKPYELRDGKQPGLLLRVQPSGVKSWVVVYTVNDGKSAKTRKTIGDASIVTLARARTHAKEITAKAERGIDPFKDQKSATSSLLGKYINGPYKEYAEAHILSHKDILRRLKQNWDHLYKRNMAEIGPLDIQRWRKRKAAESKPVSFETLQRELTYLKACLNTAVREHKVIPGHQLGSYTLTRDTGQLQTKKDTSPRYLSRDEENSLRAAMITREQRLRNARERMKKWQGERGHPLSPSIPAGHYADHIQPIVLLALNTGLRRGDLFSLEWRHVDLKNNQIRKVVNKTRRKNHNLTPAVLPLSPEASRVLRQWRQQTEGKELVFPSPVSGKQLNNIKKAWERLVKDAGLTSFRFHDLRHTFASRLVMAGIPLNTVRELMTHSDPKMTLVYAHLSPDHKEDAIKKVFGGEL
jgi:integrase